MPHAEEFFLVDRWLVFILTFLRFGSMFEYLVDEVCHAFFALKSCTLNALETLCIGFFSKHFLFVW